MKAYKTYSTITDSKEVVLSDLPFSSGEKVEIVVRGIENNGAERVRKLSDLFKETQALPSPTVLSEDDILRELA